MLSELLTGTEEAFNNACHNALVINAHGGKTNNTFNLDGHILLTPDSLLTDYTYSTATRQSAVEKHIRKGELKPIQHGQWTTYGLDQSTLVPDVTLNLLNGNIKTFAASLAIHDSWKGISQEIDNKDGHYCDKDPESCLIIKKLNGTYDCYKGAEAKGILQQIASDTYTGGGDPVCFYAPKVNKCKILSKINLSEILPEIKKVAGERMFVLATFNAGTNPKNIHLEHTKPSIPLKDVLTKVNPKIIAIKEEDLTAEPNTQGGSNPGGIYKDTLNKRFYVKFPHKRKWDGNIHGDATYGSQTFGKEMGNNAVKNEVLAAKFYQLGGIRVPTLSLVETKDKGCLGIASEMVEFTQFNQLTGEQKEKVINGDIQGLSEGFAFDAWLGCWDVYGANGDNIGIVKHADGRQEVMRIDVGGALEYRACGLLKKNDKNLGNGDGFTKDYVREIDSLKQYNDIFKTITDEQIKKGVEKIAKISDESIKKMIRDNNGPGDTAAQERLATKLTQRKKFLMQKYGVSPDIITFEKNFKSLNSAIQGSMTSSIAGPPLLQPITTKQFEDYLTTQKTIKHNLPEPEFKNISGKKQSAGVLIVEDDGRVWMYKPTGAYGGYHNTFPKGRLDDQSPPIAAIREAFEETGLQVEIIGYLGDFEKSTTNNRYYIAKRVGGAPFGWKGTDLQPMNKGEIEETAAVLLVESNKLKELEALNVNSAKGMDLPIVSKFLDVQQEAMNLGNGSFFKGLEIIKQKLDYPAKELLDNAKLDDNNTADTEDTENLSNGPLGSKLAATEIQYYSKIFDEKISAQIENNCEFQNTKYIPIPDSSQSNSYKVGELRRNEINSEQINANELLAVLKNDSIECPRTQNSNDKLITVQYHAFITFLKIASELASNDAPATIEINQFSPPELTEFLTLLNKQDKIPNIILTLPSSKELCIYGGNKCYTDEQYQDALSQIKKYNDPADNLSHIPHKP